MNKSSYVQNAKPKPVNKNRDIARRVIQCNNRNAIPGAIVRSTQTMMSNVKLASKLEKEPTDKLISQNKDNYIDESDLMDLFNEFDQLYDEKSHVTPPTGNKSQCNKSSFNKSSCNRSQDGSCNMSIVNGTDTNLTSTTAHVDNHDMLFFDDDYDDEEILNELGVSNDTCYNEQNKLKELEKKEYFEAVYDFLKTRYAMEPGAVILDMASIEPFPICRLFDLYIEQFPAGMFALVYQLDEKVVVTRYKSKKMLRAQSTTETDYEFVISKSNKITFTINSANKFKNVVVIKTKHRITTIYYNLDVHVKDLDNGNEYNEKAISLQLFR